MDPYQACPCGSGKNFKWCCQPFYHLVEKARKQHSEGQHETALRTIQQLVAQHPTSAPALGYQAELLYMNGRPEDADESLQKAFALNPDFPFGHWLRGILRKDEGEIIGALIQFRKAAELYDPKSSDVLAEIHAAIFDIEMRLNRPVAARASLEKAIHCDPAADELRKAFDQLYGPESRLPQAARHAYTFRPADSARAEAWKAALPAHQQTRLGDAIKAFEKLTAEDANDAPAWFNLGVVRAWQGEHPRAIEALTRCVELDADDARNAEVGALIEVLRCGEGMEEQSDYVEHRVFFQIQQAQPVIGLLEGWGGQSRLTGVQQDQENGTLSGLILEETPQFGLGVGATMAKLGCYLFIVQNIMRLWHPNKEAVNKVADEIVAKIGGAVTAPVQETGFSNFSDVTLEAMLFPTRDLKIEEATPKILEHARSYFEETWLHRPLKALSGVPPVDAAGSPLLRKRLLGVLRFVEECFLASSPSLNGTLPYDFNRLRRKLGLTAGGPAAHSTTAEIKIDELSTAELAGLEAVRLTDEQLDQAFLAALKLDARELAGTFARVLVKRPANAAQPDRYPYFNHLIQFAQAENDSATIMTLLDEAEKADVEANSGLRQGDYGLRRAETHAKRGEVETAYQVLQALLTLNADNLKYYGPAIEAMLGQKQGKWALEFADKGLAKARSQNNRDSEQYFMELAAAARKQIG